MLLNGASTLEAGESIESVDVPYEYERTVVGLERKIDRSALKIFPNPSESGIFYLCEEIPFSAALSVTDVVGREVLPDINGETDDTYVDLSSHSDGVYLITIHADNNVYSNQSSESKCRLPVKYI